MVRPIKPDRNSVALTHVRISLTTKRLLQDLKQKHGFATTDQVLRYYLPSNVAANRPIFHTAREIYDFTKQQPEINRMIKDASNQIMRNINKTEPSLSPSQSKPSASLMKQKRFSKARSRSSFKSHYKF